MLAGAQQVGWGRAFPPLPAVLHCSGDTAVQSTVQFTGPEPTEAVEGGPGSGWCPLARLQLTAPALHHSRAVSRASAEAFPRITVNPPAAAVCKNKASTAGGAAIAAAQVW